MVFLDRSKDHIPCWPFSWTKKTTFLPSGEISTSFTPVKVIEVKLGVLGNKVTSISLTSSYLIIISFSHVEYPSLVILNMYLPGERFDKSILVLPFSSLFMKTFASVGFDVIVNTPVGFNCLSSKSIR